MSSLWVAINLNKRLFSLRSLLLCHDKASSPRVGLQKKNDYKWIKYVESPASIGLTWFYFGVLWFSLLCINIFRWKKFVPISSDFWSTYFYVLEPKSAIILSIVLLLLRWHDVSHFFLHISIPLTHTITYTCKCQIIHWNTTKVNHVEISL